MLLLWSAVRLQRASPAATAPLPSQLRRPDRLARRRLATHAQSGAAVAPQSDVYFSGIQPTGRLHIGNYLGAVRQWVDVAQRLERTADAGELFVSVVDLHALTAVRRHSTDAAEHGRGQLAGDQLRAASRATARTLLAAGLLGPAAASRPRVHLFVQSAVGGAHTTLAWVLACLSPLGALQRMIQFKEKARAGAAAGASEAELEQHAMLGLLSYPVLQAADVLLYRAGHVPVGADQRQHLELAQRLASAFNQHYAPVFPLPEPRFPLHDVGSRVMSLRDGRHKMSKSEPSDASRINLDDSPELIQQKIRRARTDSLPGIEYAPAQRPEVSNLLGLLAALSGQPVQQVANEWASRDMARLKTTLADALIAHLAPFRANLARLDSEPELVDQLLALGAARAAQRATATLHLVHHHVGLVTTASTTPELLL